MQLETVRFRSKVWASVLAIPDTDHTGLSTTLFKSCFEICSVVLYLELYMACLRSLSINRRL